MNILTFLKNFSPVILVSIDFELSGNDFFGLNYSEAVS